MEEKIISMHVKGMTTDDIDLSDSTISRIADKILPIVKEWQEQPLEELYKL